MRMPLHRSAQTRRPLAPRLSSCAKPSPLECLRSLPRERSKSSTFRLSILEPSASTATVREARIATHSRRESEFTHSTSSGRLSALFFAPPHRRNPLAMKLRSDSVRALASTCRIYGEIFLFLAELARGMWAKGALNGKVGGFFLPPARRTASRRRRCSRSSLA